MMRALVIVRTSWRKLTQILPKEIEENWNQSQKEVWVVLIWDLTTKFWSYKR